MRRDARPTRETPPGAAPARSSAPRGRQPGRAPGAGELAVAALVAALAAAALLFEPLFAGRSIQSFPLDDPRVDIRPWARPAEGPLPPINPITADIDMFVLPGLVRTRQLLRDEGAAWWDGGQLLGYPLAANQPYPLFSPLAWLTRGMDPIDALDVLVWMHTAIAALLAYRAARLLGCGAAAGALAGVGFAASTWMITRWHLPQIMITSSWWPGLVAGAEWIARGRAWRGLLEIALFGALALVSGFPQVALVLLVGTALLLLLDPRAWRLRAAAPAAAGLALALGLTWGPFAVSAEAYAHSVRSSERSRIETALHGLRPGALAGAVLPEVFGRPSDFSGPDPPAPTMEDWLPRRLLLSGDIQDNVVENALYPGVLVLLLTLAALRRGAPRGSRRLALLAALVVGGCVAWPHLAALRPDVAAALGAGSVKRSLVLVAGCLPLAAALALQALLEGRLRAPLVAAGLACAALAVLPAAAARLDDPAAAELSRRLGPQVVRQIALVAVSLAVLSALARRAAARGGGSARSGRDDESADGHGRDEESAAEPGRGRGRGRHGWLAAVPALVVAVDLGAAAWAFNPFPVQRPAIPDHPVLAALAGRDGRVAVLGEVRVLPPTATAVHGVRSVHGVAPMVPSRVLELLGCVEDGLADLRDPRIVSPFRHVESLDHPVLDLLGVRTVAHGDPALVAAIEPPPFLLDEAAGVALHDRPSGGPRAFLCGGAEVVTDAAERLARLRAGAVELDRTVLLEVPPEVTLPARAPVPARPVEVRSASEREHALRVAADVPGILVFNEAWDPGWSVEVDGVAREVLIADHALLGVALRPGDDEVRWRYEPPGWSGARWVMLTSALLLAGAGAAAWREGRAARGGSLA